MSLTTARCRPKVRLFALLAGLYVLASLVLIYKQTRELERERRRVYYIADHLEVMKAAVRDAGLKFEPRISLRDRRVHIDEVDPARCVLPKGQRCFTLTYSAPSAERRAQLDDYFSDLVLGRYFSLITTEDERFLEFGWDKP